MFFYVNKSYFGILQKLASIRLCRLAIVYGAENALHCGYYFVILRVSRNGLHGNTAQMCVKHRYAKLKAIARYRNTSAPDTLHACYNPRITFGVTAVRLGGQIMSNLERSRAEI